MKLPALLKKTPYTSKRIKDSWRKFKYVIYIYCAFILLALSMGIWNKEYVLLLEGWIGLPEGFVGAWFPALCEDILFFGTAFVSLIVSTTLARDEQFHLRVSALANGMNISSTVEKRLQQEVEKLLSYNREYKVHLTIAEVDKTNRYLTVISDMECCTANMCDDRKVQSYINAYVEPCKSIDSISLGSIHHLSYVLKKHKKDKKQGILIEEISKKVIFQDAKYHSFDTTGGAPYKYDETIYIDENGFVDWKLTFKVAMPYGGDPQNEDYWFYSVLNGYTENYRFTIVNESKEDVNFTYNYNKNENFAKDAAGVPIPGCVLKPNESSVIVAKSDCNKGDTFGVYFNI